MNRRDSDEFESFLRQRSVLPGRLSDPVEPPAALDEIVLDRARRAIRAPQPLPRYRAPRWAFPVALAATLLLTLSVAVNVGLNSRHHPVSFETPVQNASPPDSQSTAAPSPSAVAPVGAAGATPYHAPDAGAHPRANTTEARTAPEAHPLANATQASAGREARERVNADQVAPLSAVSSAKRSQALHADPDSWLQHIRKLREAGRLSEADAELRHFEAVFPDYPTTAAQPRPAQVPK